MQSIVKSVFALVPKALSREGRATGQGRANRRAMKGMDGEFHKPCHVGKRHLLHGGPIRTDGMAIILRLLR